MKKPHSPPLVISIFDDKLMIRNTSIPLDPYTIYNGIIFKPSDLVEKLSNYVKKTNLESQPAIIRLPATIQTLSPTLPFIVLQYALIIAKANITIATITDSTQSTNLLLLLQPSNHRSPKLWLATTAIALCSLGLTIWGKQQQELEQYSNLQKQLKLVETTHNDYEKQYKETIVIEKNIKQLQEKERKARDILKSRYNPTILLNSLAHTTPPSIVLTKISLNQKTKTTTQKNKNTKEAPNNLNILIEGTSFNTKAISQLLKNLSGKTTGITHPTLIHVSKEKPKTKTSEHTRKLYHFVIEGTGNHR